MSASRWEAMLTVPVAEGRDHIQGPADATVTLVEYGDFECPYSGAAYPIVKDVQARMGARLRFVFRNFPLSTLHPHAEQAAEAAESAAAHGKFWGARNANLLHQRSEARRVVRRRDPACCARASRGLGPRHAMS